jgi:5,10-methenyltetrahydrofolate synthetase
VPERRQIVIPQAVLAPLVGFDRGCYRLGYGGGYFDRTLAALAPRPWAIGVGFELSRLETIYPQSFDIPMDLIVTEAGTQRR